MELNTLGDIRLLPYTRLYGRSQSTLSIHPKSVTSADHLGLFAMADIKNLDLSGIARGTFGSVRSY